jgi:hypothetical protein
MCFGDAGRSLPLPLHPQWVEEITNIGRASFKTRLATCLEFSSVIPRDMTPRTYALVRPCSPSSRQLLSKVHYLATIFTIDRIVKELPTLSAAMTYPFRGPSHRLFTYVILVLKPNRPPKRAC